MFKRHHDASQVSLIFLFIGWLILGIPTAAVAADNADAPPSSAGRAGVSAAIASSEVDEPPPDPLTDQGAGGPTADSEVDEPPPDPLTAGPGWWQNLLSRFGKILNL